VGERLEAIRREIDDVDTELQRLMNERARLAQAVAALKEEAPGPGRGFYRPEREAQILRRVQTRNEGPLPDEAVGRIFRELMSACLALEQPLQVAYLGPEGTFTQAATLKHFGHAVGMQPSTTIDAVFRAVEGGEADCGVVPVENSTEGMVTHTLDMFLRSPLRVTGEVALRVQLQLASRATDLGEVTRIYGHQQALAQARGWLDVHLPRVPRQPSPSNAQAAAQAAGHPDAAAICSDAAAELHGLAILAPRIEDEPDNTTRFLVIGPDPVPPSGSDKTSLLLSALNRPGTLHRLLTPLAKQGLSMTRIESRPSRQGLWDYVFFVDIEGHSDDSPVAGALAELEETAALCRVLGSYPKAVS